MKKFISILLILILALSGMCICVNAEGDYPEDETFFEGDYEYAIRDDGTAEIRDYFGKDKKVTVPSKIADYKVTKLAVYSFQDCENLESITIPDTVTAIADGVFSGCVSLTDVKIPDTVTIIGAWVFADCFSLESISIPKSVTKITHNAFSRCNSLSKIEVNYKNAKYDSRENCNAIIESSTNKLIVGCKNSTIPDTVQVIGEDAFSCCYTLENITIPESVEKIEDRAFMSCSSLKEIKIPASVKSVGEWAFSNCTSLATAEIKAPLEKLSGWMFADCSSLSMVIIPDTVNTLGESAFVGCSSLKSIEIPESVKRINDWVFCNCSSLSDVKLPDGLEKIGYETFSKCVSLKSVVIPQSVNSIGFGAFYGCGTEYIVVLNPQCNIQSDSDHSYTVMKDTVVYSTYGSTAETFANENSLEFLPYCKAPSFSHNEVVLEGKPATDNEPGFKDGLQCVICNEITKEQEEIPALRGILGDVDGDLEVSVMDATAVQLHVARMNLLDDRVLHLADTDKDNDISVMDATAIQLFVARIITEF